MARLQTITGGREATTGVIPGRWALSVGNPRTQPVPGFRWTLLTHVARLESGHTPSRRKPEYWNGDIPWIGIRDATANHGRVIYSTNQSITEEGVANSSTRVLPAGTVCLSRTASVGYVVTMGSPMATSQDFVNWFCGPELLSRYLHYILVSEQESIRRFAHGSVHPTVYYPEAKAFYVCIPRPKEQAAIVAILGALDDKIAVNDRIAATTLALVDSIFDSIVAGIVPGPDTFGSVAEVFGGGTPRTSEPNHWDGVIAWTTPTDVTGLGSPYLFHTKRTITESGLDNCASRLNPAGSIFMTSRATIGAFAVPQIPAAVNQGFIVVVPPRRELRWWLFHEMRSRLDEMISLANGSTFLELSRKNFKTIPVRLGREGAISRFDAQANPLHERAAKGAEESKTLTKLRDAILPKLLSGEIRVRDAEKAVEEAT